MMATIAVWRISGDTETTLPVLIEGLRSGDDPSLSQVVDALGEMGPAARPAVPDLLALLATNRLSTPVPGAGVSWFVRSKTTNALAQINAGVERETSDY
jgi:hypothetical protein